MLFANVWVEARQARLSPHRVSHSNDYRCDPDYTSALLCWLEALIPTYLVQMGRAFGQIVKTQTSRRCYRLMLSYRLLAVTSHVRRSAFCVHLKR